MAALSVVTPDHRSLLSSKTVISRVGFTAVIFGGMTLGVACGPAASHASRTEEPRAAAAERAADTDNGAAPASTVAVSRTVFEVSGMRCVSCAERIVAELESLDGVRRVAFSEEDALFAVDHDELRIAAQGLEARIERLGYEAVRRVDEPPTRPPAVQVAF